LTISSYGQSIQLIDSLVSLIDRTDFSDSIIVDSNNNCSKFKTVTGYKTNDSIKKIEVVIDSSKSYTIYFWHFYPTYNELIFVKEKCHLRERQYYFCGDTIIIDSKKHYIYDSVAIFDLGSTFDYIEFLVEKQIIDNTAEHYTFIGKLIEIPKGINSCGGIIPSGAAFKYEVIETDYKNYCSKYVIINTACPPKYGKDFFIAGSKYKIRGATNNGASFSIKIINEYSAESIPEYWSRQIEKIE